MDSVQRGEAAKRILNDDIFQEAVSQVASAVTSRWSVENDPDKREELWAQQKALTSVVTNLTAAMESGKYDRVKLDSDSWYK